MPWKTQCRPRVTVELWYGNRSGTRFCSRYSSVATTGGAPCGMMTANTWSCSTSLRVSATASCVLYPSSYQIVRTSRPWMPPPSLTALKPRSTPNFVICSPVKASGPENEFEPPSRISVSVTPCSARAGAATITTRASSGRSHPDLMVVLLVAGSASPAPSVGGLRPGAPRPRPPCGGSFQSRPRAGRTSVGGLRPGAPRLRSPCRRSFQSTPRARRHRWVACPPCAEPPHGTRDAARHEQHRGDQDRAKDQWAVVLEAREGVVQDREHRRAGHRARDRSEAAEDDHRHEVHRQEHVEGVGREEADDEGEGERRHREIEAFEPEAGHPEQESDRRGDERRREERHDDRDAGRARGHDRGGVRAHCEEPRVAERELVRVPGEEVEPDRHDRVDDDEARQEDEVARRRPRPEEQFRRADRQREEPHQNFRRTTPPSMPPGRIRRIAISARKGTECLIDDGR